MEVRRCMKCMHELQPGQAVCPNCGQAYGSAKAESFALKPGTILDGKYLVGQMLGQGGFGITYIGFDLLLEQKVAIKEYFPMSTGMVSRENHSAVVWSSAVMQKTGAEKGFDSFLKEARKMAKLGGIPGVVGVKSVFIQNETAYIVMDFVEGETLLKKLQREGPMSFDTCISLLTPIMKALEEVHRHGIIHRDISPDNIMVQPDGKLVLLDLGAAKDFDIQKAAGTVQSSQMVAKHGFSPFEQYTRNGNIGPWTDVYAMAATIYYCCTGTMPPPATDRLEEDTLSCRPLLTKGQFDALAFCMGVMAKDRPQNIPAMMQLLSPAPEPPKPKPAEPKPVRPPKKELPKWLIPAVAGIAAVCVAAAVVGGKQSERAAPETLPVQTAVVETKATVPVETIPAKVNTMASGDAMRDFSGLFNSSERPKASVWGQKNYQRQDVKTITFRGSLDGAPAEAWDISEAGDRSILAWMEDGNLFVAADGWIAPNPEANGLFEHMVNLKKIDFGNCFTTANVTNMTGMFSGCSSLTQLELSGFDTSNVTDMNHLFDGCRSLASLDISGFNTGKAENMVAMFADCSNLSSLDLSGFDTSKVTVMGWMFEGCRSLTSLDLSGFNTSRVTNMTSMFDSCESLTSLDLSGFNTINVVRMEWMFSQCSSLTSVDISSFDTVCTENMRFMFAGCSSLSSLDLSGLDTFGVTDMSYMFDGCSSLTSLNLSGSFDTSKATDMAGMFQDCSSLTSLNLSWFNASSVKNMSNMFRGCSSLTSLDLSRFNTSSVVGMGCMFKDCSSLTSLKCSDSKILEAYNNR